MNNSKITFELNKTEKIVINFQDQLDVIDCCYKASFILLQDGKTVFLSYDSIKYKIETLKQQLDKVLHNKLTLHKSITKDIGYLENEDFQNRPNLFYEENNGQRFWVGNQYRVWSSQSSLTTWLYNDVEGAIIFEMTPVYPYHFSDPENESNFIPYEQWIKDYQPYLIREISEEIAQQWLDQANKLLEIIEKNTNREKLSNEYEHATKN